MYHMGTKEYRKIKEGLRHHGSYYSTVYEQIRAGHLSGDCHYKREFLRGFLKIRGHEQVSFISYYFV